MFTFMYRNVFSRVKNIEMPEINIYITKLCKCLCSVIKFEHKSETFMYNFITEHAWMYHSCISGKLERNEIKWPGEKFLCRWCLHHLHKKFSQKNNDSVKKYFFNALIIFLRSLKNYFLKIWKYPLNPWGFRRNPQGLGGIEIF